MTASLEEVSSDAVAAAAEEVVVAEATLAEVAESAAEAEAEDADEPPVTPSDAWPALATSVAMFLLNLVCSSCNLLSRSEVSSPEALA